MKLFLKFIFILYVGCYRFRENIIINKDKDYIGEFFFNLELFRDEQLFGKINLNIITENNNLIYQNLERNVIFDTGSNLLWVRPNLENKNILKNENQNKNKNLLYFIKYRTGNVTIQYFNSILNNFNLNNFNLGVSVFEDKEVFNKMPNNFNGILGLGFKVENKIDKNYNNNLNSIIDFLFIKNILKNNIFSFYLTKNENNLIFGNIHKSIRNFNNFHYIDITHEDFKSDKHLWKIKTESILINNINICKNLNGCYLVIDSGTSYYSLSEKMYMRIKENIKFDKLCLNYEDIPDIIINLTESKKVKIVDKNSDRNNIKNSKNFNLTLTKKDYITRKIIELNIEDNFGDEIIKMNKCELDFSINNNTEFDNVIIVGIKFLRKFYTIFDFERRILGFNKHGYKENDNNDNVVEYKELFNNSIKEEEKEIVNLINDWKKVYG